MYSSTDGNAPPNRNTKLLVGLVGLVLLSVGLFVPQLADAFHVKNHVIALGGCLVFLVGLPDQRIELPVLIRLALLACFSALLVSSLAATQAVIAWRCGLELVPLGLVFYLLSQQRDPTHIAELLDGVWRLSALGVAVMGLLQAANPPWLDVGFWAPGKLASFSTMGNSIWASIVLVVALPLAVRKAMQGPRLLWLVPPVLLAGLWATHSRQAWLALALLAWIAVFWKGGLWQRRAALAVLLVLCCALPFVNFESDAFHSIQGRMVIMRGVWQMFLDHPLTGVGLGQLGAAYPPYQAALLAAPAWQSYWGHAAVIEDAHNEYLHWAASTGVLGFGGFTLLCGTIAWMGWRSTRVRDQLWHWYLGYVGLLATLLFTGIQAQSVLVLLLVCCMTVVLNGAMPPALMLPTKRYVRLGATVITVVFAVLTGLWAQQDLRAGYLEGQGDRLMQERDAWLARETYGQALGIDAQRASLLRKHASTLYLEGSYAQALIELSKAQTLSGDTGITLLKAEILTKTGHDVEAIAAYQSIVASFPQLLSPRFILGQLYYRQRQPALARAEFEHMLDTVPSVFNQQLSLEKVQQQKQMARAFIAAIDRQNPGSMSVSQK